MNYHLSLINNVWAGKDQYKSQDVEQTNCKLNTVVGINQLRIFFLLFQEVCLFKTIYILDAVGSSQIFFPTQNLERAYQVDKESKAVLSYFQYDQCAGPQKQEDINGHSSTIVGQKIKVRDVFQSGNQGNFLVLSKKIRKKNLHFFFQPKLTYDGQKFKKIDF